MSAPGPRPARGVRHGEWEGAAAWGCRRGLPARQSGAAGRDREVRGKGGESCRKGRAGQGCRRGRAEQSGAGRSGAGQRCGRAGLGPGPGVPSGAARPRAAPRSPTARPGRDVSGWGRAPPADWAVLAARGGGRPMGAGRAGARAVICARGAARSVPAAAGHAAGATRGAAGPASPSHRIARGAHRPQSAGTRRRRGLFLPGLSVCCFAALPRLGFRRSSAWTLEVRAAGEGGQAPGFSCSHQTSALAVAEIPRAARSPSRPRPRSRQGSPAERPRRDWEGPTLADARRC